MDVSEFIAAVTGCVGMVTGVIALLQSRKANKLAQDSNRVAEEANRLAVKANDLARDANDVGEHANAVAQRAADAASDQTDYEWAAQLDAEHRTLIVFNDSALDARDLHIVVRFEDETVCDHHVERCAAFSQLTLQAELLVEKLREKQVGRRGLPGVYGQPVVKVGIHIVWTSELGVRRSHNTKQGFGYRSGKKSI